MKSKIVVTVALLLAIAVTAVVFGSRWAFGTKTAAQQPTAPEGSIRWHAQQARSQGESEVAVSSQISYPVPNDIGEAISISSLLVGQLAATSISWDDTTGEITTWYKFNITETLVQRPYESCENCTPAAVPTDLQPVTSGQVVVGIAGGSALIDDVVVEEMLPGFSGLVVGQRYLLFLNFDPTTNVGELDWGPTGARLVSGQNTFMPVVEFLEGQADDISSGLSAQYGNSLTQLRAALNPTTCDQLQRQNCIDDGGTWSDANCTCQPAFDPCIPKPWLCE